MWGDLIQNYLRATGSERAIHDKTMEKGRGVIWRDDWRCGGAQRMAACEEGTVFDQHMGLSNSENLRRHVWEFPES